LVKKTYKSYSLKSLIFDVKILGNTGITIPKGLLIHINISGIHRDPEYYPNPDCFDPERFMPENRHKLIPYTFLPFGIGPRNCVGIRFALMEAKTAIAHIIPKFKFVRTENTEVPIEMEKMSFILSPKRDIKVAVQMRSE
jgi:cytochrome P450 family 9